MSKALKSYLSMHKDCRAIGYRLSFWLPLCPWPVFLWIQSQGEYMWTPRHSAEAMNAVAFEARLAVIVSTTVAAALAGLCAKTWEQRGWSLAFLIIHFWIIKEWVVNNAVAYA